VSAGWFGDRHRATEPSWPESHRPRANIHLFLWMVSLAEEHHTKHLFYQGRIFLQGEYMGPIFNFLKFIKRVSNKAHTAICSTTAGPILFFVPAT